MYLLLALLMSNLAFAQTEKVYAFACTWDNGEIVFSTSVKEGETKIVRTYDQAGETVTITIEDLVSSETYSKVSISSGKRVFVKTAKCLMEQE